MASMMRRHSYGFAIAIVLGTIAIQLLAAALLKYVADRHLALGILTIGTAIVAAVILNVARFGLWGVAHRLFPLSRTYPLTALFFPCVLGLSLVYGESITIEQLAGTALITAGVALMGLAKHSGSPK